MLAIPVHATLALNCLPINQHSIKTTRTAGVSISEIADNSTAWKRSVLMSVLLPKLAVGHVGFLHLPFHNMDTFSYKLLLFTPPTHIFPI